MSDADPAAAWGDAAVIVPWVLYERFGDAGVLAASTTACQAWVDLVDGAAGRDRLWDDGLPARRLARPRRAARRTRPRPRTDRYLVATAYFARSAQRLADTAAVLGRDDDADALRRAGGRGARAFTDASTCSPAGG